ncbi:uncharacterized protein [Diadema antillarum]|uniref:uncharacterized protein n=1 Tax=Diadema antillarum TaxID=105358 RepID=UPI003A870C4C
MKIAMAESMGSILSHFTQGNNQQETESLEMEETGEMTPLQSSSAELTSEDLSSERDAPDLPPEESAAVENVAESFSDALSTQEDTIQEDFVSGDDPTDDGGAAASGSEPGSQENGELPAVDLMASGDSATVPAKGATPGEQVEGKTARETKKEGKKSKKGKDAEHMSRAIMQALNGLETPEEKIAALCKKYAELLGEHKSLQRESKSQAKQLSQIQRERDHLQSEHGRALLAKSKLESLCRELQRHNKTIKEESLQRAREEDEKRKEVSNKFQQTINEITTQMQDNHTRNIKLKEENIELASKLKNLVEQYERREEHIEKLFKHKDLESQLYDAKLQQSNLALAEEKERNKREKEVLLTESVDSKRKLEMLTKQEAQLKAQLAVYTEKFEEFQSTLTKSNEVFQTFKQEMDKMTKKIKKLEKETNMWRVRWENSNKSLLQMAEEKGRHEKEMLEKQVKITRLEKLCRALQAERNALIGKARSAQDGLSTPPAPPNVLLDLTSAPPPTCNGEILPKASPESNPSPTEDSSPGGLTEEGNAGSEAVIYANEVEAAEAEGRAASEMPREPQGDAGETIDKDVEGDEALDVEEELLVALYAVFLASPRESGANADTCSHAPQDMEGMCPYRVSPITGEYVKLTPKYIPSDHTQYDAMVPEEARGLTNLYCTYPAACPSSWPMRESADDSCYLYRSEMVSWWTARDGCVGEGAHLVATETTAELATVLNFISYQSGLTSLPRVWTGLNDEAVVETYVWDGFGGTLPWNSPLWTPGQPDDIYGERCVGIVQGGLHNIYCSDQYGYVCEYRP